MIWNYVELTVGIIAGSLPALKPLFTRMLNAARERTTAGTDKVSGHGRPNTLGYHRQSDRSKSGIVLSEYTPGNRASGAVIDRSVCKNLWNGAGNESGESVLPLHGLELKANAILVTKDFHVG
jgi:hypothetical protein